MEQVREAFDSLWKTPERTGEVMAELRTENEGIYRVEEMLEKGEPEPNNDSLNVEQ